MEHYLLVIILITLAMIFALVLVVLYLGYRLLQAKNHNQKLEAKEPFTMNLHQGVIDRLGELNLSHDNLKHKKEKKLVQNETQYYCKHHAQEFSEGVCAICEDAFCSHCLKRYKNLSFCNEHLKLFINAKWVQVASVKTNPNETEAGVVLYQLKKELWSKEKIPAYLETQYKIDIDHDYIESFATLFAREDDYQKVSQKLNP